MGTEADPQRSLGVRVPGALCSVSRGAPVSHTSTYRNG